MLDKKILSELLPMVDVRIYDTVGSTNAVAIELSEGCEQNILVAAFSQTEGRGRQGKEFFSPSGGLYFSLAIHPDCELIDAVSITSATAVFVADAIERLTLLSPKIKWVNDIYIDRKKVCGILCQSVLKSGKLDRIIIGIGINIKAQNFPKGINSIAGSLNTDIDENALTAEITKSILRFCENPSDKAYLDYYRKNSCVLGNKIIFYENGIKHFGNAVGIDDNAALIVEQDGVIKKLSGGEITVRVDEN